MSRARTRKQEETKQFLQQNPEAVEHETQVSVEKNGFFEMVASDGENPLPLFNQAVAGNNKATFLAGAETLEGEFYAYDISEGGEDHGNGEDLEIREGRSETFITLSKNGIGVLGEDESSGEDGGNPPRESRALDDDEVFGFLLDGGLLEPPRHLVQRDGDWIEDNEGDYGLSGVNVEFEVLNNKGGTVSLVMFDPFIVLPEPFAAERNGRPEPGDPPIFKDVEIGPGEKGRVEDIGFYLPDGPLYNGFEIFVEGDVQIALVGIDYSTEGQPQIDLN